MKNLPALLTSGKTVNKNKDTVVETKRENKLPRLFCAYNFKNSFVGTVSQIKPQNQSDWKNYEHY